MSEIGRLTILHVSAVAKGKPSTVFTTDPANCRRPESRDRVQGPRPGTVGPGATVGQLPHEPSRDLPLSSEATESISSHSQAGARPGHTKEEFPSNVGYQPNPLRRVRAVAERTHTP